MADKLQIDIKFGIQRGPARREYAMGIDLGVHPKHRWDRLVKMLFDSGMQSAIKEVNKLNKEEAASAKVSDKGP